MIIYLIYILHDYISYIYIYYIVILLSPVVQNPWPPSHPMAPAILLLGSSKKTMGITEDLARRSSKKPGGDFKR